MRSHALVAVVKSLQICTCVCVCVSNHTVVNAGLGVVTQKSNLLFDIPYFSKR